MFGENIEEGGFARSIGTGQDRQMVMKLDVDFFKLAPVIEA
jgi:hypothetical protein